MLLLDFSFSKIFIFKRTNRLAENDIVIEGYTIPKGTDISFPIYSIHRDPRFWENPTKFDPERYI